ncbi:spore germination protein [Lederbergia galactosidilytica]|uniref:Spore gernimation protein KB n=1 Tax=Lederbergia galactosidilytica TaxID=217031 RepID=A0A178A187_9BACI|nr:spore germination protein [Lederbergia galactosidilytica]OAK73864.1 spore gernimation protein KB [Lederbergia galactosidilytica]
MFSFFKKKYNQTRLTNDKSQKDLLGTDLSETIQRIKKETGNSSDIVIRELELGEPGFSLVIVYVEGIIDDLSIHDFIIESILASQIETEREPQEFLQVLTKKVIAMGPIQKSQEWNQLYTDLMDGNTIVLIDGMNTYMSIETQGGEKRAIEEPESQVTVRGPRDGFTEALRTNTALVRKRIRNPNLWTESMKIGTRTKTNVEIMYLNGVVNEQIVAEVRRRLQKIEIDAILESGYIEQLIEDQVWTTFPTLYHTERPDSVAGNILEGRVAIFVDGTPFVLLAPAVFIQFFQSVEDYYARFDIATALRFLRIVTFLLSIIAPSVYIAGTTFHQEMIPTELAIIIAAQRETVPFPAFVEAIIMEITFEILREAGVRMPRAVGSAISIVGALVIGQAAVQAGIVSPAMVIIVSITAIANFATPSFAMAISARLIRFAFMVTAATFGLYGVMMGIIFLTLHLCSLRSFGVPYMTPMAPVTAGNLGDTLIRIPLWTTRKRANLIMKGQQIYAENMPKPGPPAPRTIRNRDSEKGDNNDS